MFWQKKVWSDYQVCLHWAETYPKDHPDEQHVRSDGTRQYTLHFHDNLDGHISPPFIQLNHDYRSFCHFLPTNLIDNLAPSDSGMIALIKYWFFIFIDQWIWEDENIGR